MRRGMRDFFRRRQYKIAACCMAVAVLGAAGIFAYMQTTRNEEENNIVAQEEKEEKKTTITAQKEEDDKEKETKTASAVIEPKVKHDEMDQIVAEIEAEMPEIADADETDTEETAEETVETTANVKHKTELHFDTAGGMVWPVSGAVILDYSMDKTVYFTTLDQYKYNPALIIAGNVNEKVQAAASGKIVDISTNEVTGYTVTMDLGDGYTAIYGQLKEVPYNVGAYVEAGSTLGFVSEPTKYYSLEGSNLYFELRKDDAPIDPVEFFS